MEGTRAGYFEACLGVCPMPRRQGRACETNKVASAIFHSIVEMGRHLQGFHNWTSKGAR